MRPVLQQAGELLRRSAHTVALTGAGISTPSGIPDFRSPNAGLWSFTDPLEVASLWAFAEQPDAFYRWFLPLLKTFSTARPNTAHRVLAEMEAHHRLHCTITQNIDSLHQQAGSRRVLELHGNTRTASCLTCGFRQPADSLWRSVIAGGPSPRCSQCDGPMKPDVVLFGEPLPYDTLQAAQQEALHCEVMLVVGTSLEVTPAADLPLLARRRGARVILVNLTPTALDDQLEFVIHADLEPTLVALWRLANE